MVVSGEPFRGGASVRSRMVISSSLVFSALGLMFAVLLLPRCGLFAFVFLSRFFLLRRFAGPIEN